MIRFRDVTKKYGHAVALDDFSLEVAQGRMTVLIGPSGCGKSTALRLIVGLIRPDEGEVCFEGRRLEADNLLEIRRRIGYVIQEGGLFPHLTGRGNAVLMPEHLGWSRERARERLDELSELVRLAPEMLDRYPAQLSGGQRQRVGLVRALMLDPPLLLLDEPLGSLDPMIRADLQEDLRGIFRELQKTVVMVTHDLAEASFFADHLVLMRQGSIAQQGPPEDLFDRPAAPFVKAFVRAQRMNVRDDAGKQ